MADDPVNSPADAGRLEGAAPYRKYWEEMPCYLSVHDRDFRIIEGNRRFRADFGDRIGDFCFRVYKQREEICPNCPVEATFDDGQSHSSEQTLTTREGESLPVMVHTTPIRDEKGEVEAVMEMHTDIGEVKRLEGLLRDSEKRFAALFEEVPCHIAVHGPDLVIRHANRKFREAFGPSVGKKCYRVYKHREEQCLVCPAMQTLMDGETREHEEVLMTADGGKMNAICTTSPVHNAEGEIEAVIEMATDITQIRQLQSQLTSIGLLVGSISHGIKGLLTGLDGGIYLVNTGFAKDKPDRVKEGWAMVQRNVGRIRSMVLDILYYAKDRELTLAEIEVGPLVEEIRETLAGKVGDGEVALETQIAPDAGSFQGDANAIRAMLVNVLENSVEACGAVNKRPKREGKVSIRVVRDEPWVVFDIRDNGIGMDRETQEKIFSLFFSSKGIKGTGLGLFIANKIVDKHGGDIEVESEPGRGSRFVIRLPVDARPSTKPRK
jgi:PAS domain S-box-containing protein